MNKFKYTTNAGGGANIFNPNFVTGFCEKFTSINTKCNGIILIYPTSLTLKFRPFLDSIFILEKFYLNKNFARCLFTSSSNKKSKFSSVRN